MNETLIFTENNKMYICKRPSYISTGFRYSEVWEKCKAVPKELKNTIPRGAAVIETVDGIQYMLWNTAGEACWKWFTPLCDGNHVQIACCHKESIAYAVLFICRNRPYYHGKSMIKGGTNNEV